MPAENCARSKILARLKYRLNPAISQGLASTLASAPSFCIVPTDHPESLVAAALSLLAGRARAPALAVLLALMLAACGRYGPLEPPPDPNAPPKPASTNPASLAKPSIPPITAPKQPFFLDFLLK